MLMNDAVFGFDSCIYRVCEGKQIGDSVEMQLEMANIKRTFF